MPFANEAKARPSGTGRGCRAVVAAGMLDPGSEWTVFRALQIANFTSPTLFLDDAESIREALREVPGVDADGIAERIDDADVVAEYEHQQAEARSAAGTPSEAQDKTATSDGHVRFTAPSVVFRRGEDSAFAGGWQPLLSYDTVLANFAPELERVPPPESPEPLLAHFPAGLTTAEVALLLAVRLRSGSRPATRPSACCSNSSSPAAPCAQRSRCRRASGAARSLAPAEDGRSFRSASYAWRRDARRGHVGIHRAARDRGGGATRCEAPTPGHPGTARGPAGRVGGGRRRRRAGRDGATRSQRSTWRREASRAGCCATGVRARSSVRSPATRKRLRGQARRPRREATAAERRSSSARSGSMPRAVRSCSASTRRSTTSSAPSGGSPVSRDRSRTSRSSWGGRTAGAGGGSATASGGTTRVSPPRTSARSSSRRISTGSNGPTRSRRRARPSSASTWRPRRCRLPRRSCASPCGVATRGAAPTAARARASSSIGSSPSTKADPTRLRTSSCAASPASSAASRTRRAPGWREHRSPRLPTTASRPVRPSALLPPR